MVRPVTGSDMAMGMVVAGARAVRGGARTLGRVAAPVVRLAVDPPLMPRRWRPIRRLESWGEQWQASRDALLRRSVSWSTDLAGTAGRVVLPLVDLTPVVHAVLDRLDLDAVATSALAEVDLSRVVDQTMAQIDVGVVVDQALREVDLTDVVVSRVELGTVVGAALEQVDLTEIVVTRVDLQRVVLAALDRLDLTSIVQERVDLALIAEQVVEDIDLPDIIQASTGSVASEAVQGVRLRSVEADERLSGVADRLLLRVRRRTQTDVVLEGDVGEEDRP